MGGVVLSFVVSGENKDRPTAVLIPSVVQAAMASAEPGTGPNSLS